MATAPRVRNPRGFDFRDAGLYVRVGEDLVAHVVDEVLEERGLRVYDSLVEEATEAAALVDLSEPLDVEVAGGRHIGRAVRRDAFTMPEPITLVGRDPQRIYPLRYGAPLLLRWVPSAAEDDTVVVVVEGERRDVVLHTGDSGEVDLGALAEEAGVSLGPEPGFAISRIRRVAVPLREGALEVIAEVKQFIVGVAVGPYAVSPAVWRPGEQVNVEVTFWDGVFDGESAFLDFGEGVTVVGLEVADTAGHVLSARLLVDAAAPTGPLRLRAGNGEAVLVDAVEAAWIAAPLKSQGDCESALDEGLVEDGAYVGSLDGLPVNHFDSSSCGSLAGAGPEQAIPLALRAGERLEVRARATSGGFLPLLYLVRSCDGAEVPVVCSPDEHVPDFTRLTYTARADEDVLLVVDAQNPSRSDHGYLVDIRRKPAVEFEVVNALVTVGATEPVRLVSYAGTFSEDAADYDFGPDTTVQSVTVDPEDPALATVRLRVEGGAAVGYRAVSVGIDGGARTREDDVFYVRPWVGGPSSCALADVAGALVSGFYEGDTRVGEYEVVAPTDCPSDALGREGIYAVDLGPGETLRAGARTADWDSVLYVLTGCGDYEMLACGDFAYAGREYVEWTAGPEAMRVYLVVDGYNPGDGGVFWLDVDIRL
jgi:hypothetical protein